MSSSDTRGSILSRAPSLDLLAVTLGAVFTGLEDILSWHGEPDTTNRANVITNINTIEDACAIANMLKARITAHVTRGLTGVDSDGSSVHSASDITNRDVLLAIPDATNIATLETLLTDTFDSYVAAGDSHLKSGKHGLTFIKTGGAGGVIEDSLGRYPTTGVIFTEFQPSTLLDGTLLSAVTCLIAFQVAFNDHTFKGPLKLEEVIIF